MKLVSTRGDNRALSYVDVLLEGLAPDGGLFVPEEFPKITLGELEQLKAGTYQDVAFAVKKLLVAGALPESVLRNLIDDAYLPPAFSILPGQVVPVRKIAEGMWLQNLSLGPTAAFKDMALQLLGREMDYVLKQKGTTLTILGATSGDTGSAAEASLKGRNSTTTFMLSPKIGMSAFQRAQMGALSGGNIHNISIEGRFDDCQDLVKAVKQDPQFRNLGAVNSINWGRITAQVPYYFSGYLQVVSRVGDEVDFVVPSGNFGNVYSGYVAKQMGLPIRNLVIATNENDVLHQLLRTGVYEQKEAQITSSPSMDISKASNYERLAFDLLSRDGARLSKYMQEFSSTGKVSFADHGVSADRLSKLGFQSGSSSHKERLETIKAVYAETKSVIDPHTADGVTVARARGSQEVPVICLESALAVKFEDTIKEALGFVPPRPARFVDLESQVGENAFVTLPSDIKQLTDYLRAHQTT